MGPYHAARYSEWHDENGGVIIVSRCHAELTTDTGPAFLYPHTYIAHAPQRQIFLGSSIFNTTSTRTLIPAALSTTCPPSAPQILIPTNNCRARNDCFASKDDVLGAREGGATLDFISRILNGHLTVFVALNTTFSLCVLFSRCHECQPSTLWL